MSENNGTTTVTQPEAKVPEKKAIEMIMLGYMRPQALIDMRAKMGVQYKVGDVLDFHEDKVTGLNMMPHPQFGPIPLLRITELSTSGAPYAAEFTCIQVDCPEVVLCHAGDFFQKRRCDEHQRKYSRLAKKGIKSPEDEERVKSEREAKQAKIVAEAAQKRANRAMETAQKIVKDAEARVAKAKKEAEDKLAKIKQVAAEKGAAVSPTVDKGAEVKVPETEKAVA